jgi:hypothetical protein
MVLISPGFLTHTESTTAFIVSDCIGFVVSPQE